MDILELGGGFGGQAKIVSDVFVVSSYTIVDIPEALTLASKFLDAHPIAKAVSTLVAHAPGYRDLPPQCDDQGCGDTSNATSWGSLADDGWVLPVYDLCVSNFAWDEMNLATQELYWHRLLRRCERGYITDNAMNRVHGGQLTLDEQLTRLRSLGFEAFVSPQEPRVADMRGHVLAWRRPAQDD
mmetsp:Transcript_46598/g.109619  ORF Transcript_46598/g.109619 Transcript_46598/m.109619 type:complete len:184 (+) Transcript_46598:947-1498(+)